MKLFLPSARAVNLLLIIGFCAVGYALYVRYLVIEQSGVGLACQTGVNTWTCIVRRVAVSLFAYSVFGVTAVAFATINVIWPSLAFFALALAATGLGIVLYNVALSALAAALLILSLARPARGRA